MIQNGLVVKYQVIKHSYSTDRMKGENYAKEHLFVNICPCITSRCDCLGVVVEDD